MKDNIEEISLAIFSNPPGNPYSISLQLEESTSEIANEEGIDDYIFQILYIITFNGIKKLYGHKEILKLTETQYLVIQKYVNSYGYKMDVLANDTSSTPWEILKKNKRVFRYKVGFEPL